MAASPFRVHVDWATPLRTATTAATVEVDVMPHLSRVHEGGSFPGYFSALSDLGSRFVRFSPWFAYPRVVVAELERADCRRDGKSSWNTTHLDAIVSDFMQAVCGPDAAKGACADGLSVVPQLSTMPAWMYESDGVNRTALMPTDPWKYPSGRFNYYVVQGKPLVDPTCREMARYAARYVAWYTQGGMVDECGVRHESNLHYRWDYLSVLNEDEYRTPPGGGVQYTICWDAWKDEIAKVNSKIKLVGPETAGGPFGARRRAGANDSRELLRGQLDYSLYFLNGSHHADGRPPPFVSNHVALYGPPWDAFFTGVDEWVTHVAKPLDKARQALAPQSQLVMNEFIPFNNEWCDNSGSNRTCAWDRNSSQGVGINRATLGWSAAAASFAYGFGKLSEMGFAWVGADQLIGGAWPDNEPAVASLDWNTGEPNAKYWAVRLLAKGLGGDARTLHAGVVSGGPPPPPLGATGNGTCGTTTYGGDCNASPRGAWNTTSAHIASVDACAAKCAACSRCNFVSFSAKNEDCSWYEACDWNELQVVGAGYVSKVVKKAPPLDALYALGMTFDTGTDLGTTERRVLLLVSKSDTAMHVELETTAAGASAQVLDAQGVEPGFAPPHILRVDNKGVLALGPFAVALVTLGKPME